MKLPACDCLNYCGDDPWLEKNRSAPCPDRVEKLANELKRFQAVVRLESSINKLRSRMATNGIGS